MAERSTCRTLNSSIRSEDLLSDMELLPASVPATPSQQVPRAQSASPFASRVTTQLYTSLHQSWQAEAQARSHLEAQHSLLQARETEAPEVDLDTLAEELSHRLSTSVEASAHKKGSAIESRHISEMENVRCHLQSMLRSSREAAHGDGLAAQIFERKDDDSFESDSTAALLNARPLQEISPPGSAAGFEELFPRYTSLRLGPAREPSAYTDVHLLKDTLDKEQARRKHCERHIQALQNRLLELQQQLAVAVSADKKKDGMIEQLDKTLAKVVEGWNRHEAERTETLRRLQAEKEAAVQMLGRHKEKMQEAEGRLEEATSALSREQQAVSLYCKEKERLEEEKATLSRSLEAEGQRARSLEADWDLERRQHEALRATLEEQQRSWAQRERQVEQQVQALQEESRAQLDKEKAAVQREAQKAVDAQRVLASVQAEVQGLESELEALRQERDSLKMEMSLVKARYEAQKVKLESELKVVLEQQVTERLAEVHEESLHQMTAMREQHRKQLLDLGSRHEKELAGQLVQFKTDLAERDERHRQLIDDYEDRLSRQHEEMRELQVKCRRLEAQLGGVVAGQFQAAMQATGTRPCVRIPQQGVPSDAGPASELECLQLSESLQKDQKRESLRRLQGTGDHKRAGCPPAVPLQPVAQHNALQGSSEGPEKSVASARYQSFLPLLPDMERLSSEFSHILNCSVLSRQDFQQLEPQMDQTGATTGQTLHPENLAEHPFTDDTDDTVTEVAGNEGETSQRSSLGGPEAGSLPVLLEQNASENSAQKQEGLSGENPPHHVGQTQLGSSQSYHEPSTALWDPGRASVSAIRIQPASSAAVHKTKVPLSKAGVTCTGLEVSEAQKRNPAHEVGILSHKQVAEVSRLFKQYQAKGKPMPSTEELYGYLRSSEMKGDGNVHTRRSFDARLTEAVRKEMAPTRRTGLSRERPHAASKTGKKLSGVPNSNVRNSKGGSVWR
ncbi:LOW QUALITY PROTEIN: centrobin [Sphaerodactylus townsendi]|uniref:LOW QUALITY PROTEIN: centrobin n=1 Tax=Sphaerodactylus townsendi TaxID=933632 RepID=UPI0020273B15|nr:LOW QUALITY PROTEIN: centrobin [Sphaerodactylus townsendi]